MLYHLKRVLYRKLLRRRIFALIKRLRPRSINLEFIRLGGDSDGGYLVPKDLSDLKYCFSAGVGEVSDFELNCANLGMKIFMADASVDEPAIRDNRFIFQKKFIGSSNVGEYITLENWINSYGIEPNTDLMLQMDIEGGEFEVINSCLEETLLRFRIIVIEFHDLHKLSDKEFYQKASSTFNKILKDHVCVHIHPNNCCGTRVISNIEIPVVAEFTFIRKDRIKFNGIAAQFPHELDRDNVKNPPLVLPKIWYMRGKI